jgi:hypothetical protein
MTDATGVGDDGHEHYSEYAKRVEESLNERCVVVGTD